MNLLTSIFMNRDFMSIIVFSVSLYSTNAKFTISYYVYVLPLESTQI